jgi:hypothetical protein
MFTKVLIDPIEIEYIQFDYTNADCVRNTVSELQLNIEPSLDSLNQPYLIIPTTDGELTCHIGDYIIKYPDPKDWCKFMCCSPVVFKSLMKVFGVEL